MHGCILKILDRLLALGMQALSARAGTILTCQTCFPLWPDSKGCNAPVPFLSFSVWLGATLPGTGGSVATDITCCHRDHILPQRSHVARDHMLPVKHTFVWLFNNKKLLLLILDYTALLFVQDDRSLIFLTILR